MIRRVFLSATVLGLAALTVTPISVNQTWRHKTTKRLVTVTKVTNLAVVVKQAGAQFTLAKTTLRDHYTLVFGQSHDGGQSDTDTFGQSHGAGE